MTTATATKTRSDLALELLTGAVKPEDIRRNYQRLAVELHPDTALLDEAFQRIMQDWDGTSYEVEGRQGSYEKTYTYDKGFETFFRDVLEYLLDTPYSVELRGDWLWVGGTVQDANPFQFMGEDQPDNRPCWLSPDGRELRFQWSGRQKEYYLDLRRFLDSDYDQKKRVRHTSVAWQRDNYGSARLKRQEEESA